MIKPTILSGELSIRRGQSARVGLGRVDLLQAIADTGSISAAARNLKLSYRGAWDVVQALNNLFDKPLVVAAPGGAAGGGATLTEDGRAVVEAFAAMQATFEAGLEQLAVGLARNGVHDPLAAFGSLAMKTSARNALKGTVVRLTPGAVNGEVAVAVGDSVEIIATITLESVKDLGLEVGTTVIALIKSSFVILAKGEGLRTSARNQIGGVVIRRQDGVVNSEIVLDIGGSKTITATVTLESARALELVEGDRVTALIKAPHVILAVP